MRISVFILAAAVVGGIYYLQVNPDVAAQIKHAFSRENLLEVQYPEKGKHLPIQKDAHLSGKVHSLANKKSGRMKRVIRPFPCL